MVAGWLLQGKFKRAWSEYEGLAQFITTQTFCCGFSYLLLGVNVVKKQ